MTAMLDLEEALTLFEHDNNLRLEPIAEEEVPSNQPELPQEQILDLKHYLVFLMPLVQSAQHEKCREEAEEQKQEPETRPKKMVRHRVPCRYFEMFEDDFAQFLQQAEEDTLRHVIKTLSEHCRRISGRKSWAKTGGDMTMYEMHNKRQQLCSDRLAMARRHLKKF